MFLQSLNSLKPALKLRESLFCEDDLLKIGEDAFRVSELEQVIVVSFGKAAAPMAATTSEILHGIPLRGVVAAPGPAVRALPGLQHFQAGHPYPNEASEHAAEAVLQLLAGRSERDLVLFLISGGGSALLEKALNGSASAPVSLSDMRRFHEVLVRCGATIQEINILRKHVSAVKGGRLAEHASPASQVTLFVSDVPDDLPSLVASGPTMPDESSAADCRSIIERYGLMEQFPAAIRGLFAALFAGKIPETPKPGLPCFSKSRYHCLLSNRDAVEFLLERLRRRGIVAEFEGVPDEWNLDRAADHLLAKLSGLRQSHRGRPVAVVTGGELTSPVTASGVGGRNQAFVLNCVPKVAGRSIVVLSAGTDGIDGNSPAAGAIADGDSAQRAARRGIDPDRFVREADSYNFFASLGDAIVTGPTETNVRDLRILLDCDEARSQRREQALID